MTDKNKSPMPTPDKPTKEMKAYALEEMTRLLGNMRSRPIQCYSKKERGSDKEYYLGYKFIEDLIELLKEEYA